MNDKLFSDLIAVGKLLENPKIKKAVRDMILKEEDAHDVSLADDVAYVWCAELYELHGGRRYYHPLVTLMQEGNIVYRMPTKDMLMNADNYSMLYNNNQFEAIRYAEDARMMALSSELEAMPVMLSIPMSVFKTLNTALRTLMTNIIDEVNKVGEHLVRIQGLVKNGYNADGVIVSIMMDVLSHMKTISDCVTQEMAVIGSDDHVYAVKEHEGYDNDSDDHNAECDCDECTIRDCHDCPHQCPCLICCDDADVCKECKWQHNDIYDCEHCDDHDRCQKYYNAKVERGEVDF